MNTEQLVSEIFARNVLWDQKDPRHHNRYILDKMWGEVADKLESTRDAVRSKWKTLRDNFRKELKKVPKQRSGDEALPPGEESTWPHFKSLCFLKDQFTVRPSSGNIPSTSTVEDEIETAEALQTTNDTVDERGDTPTSDIMTQPLERGKKRARNIDIGNTLVGIEQKKLKIMAEEKNKSEDEDVSFFNSLLPHVRKLEPEQKMLLRMKIQELVYNAVYRRQVPNQETAAPDLHTNNVVNIQKYDISQPSNVSSISSYVSNYSESDQM